MIISSTFEDYYDYCDPGLPLEFIRETRTEPTESFRKFPFKILREPVISSGFITVANKVYPFIRTPKQTYYYRDLVRVTEVYENQVNNHFECNSHWKERPLDEAVFVIERYEADKSRIVINPRLADYSFSSVMDPQTCYDYIEKWLYENK